MRAAEKRVPAHEPVAYAMRAGMVESVHYGSVVVLDGDGAELLAVGDADAAYYPRSTVKPVQGTAMVRSGLDLPDELLALAVASHSGEPRHIEGVSRLLAEHGLDESELRNTPSLPAGQQARRDWLAAGGYAARLPQNCSGKHAAMLATAKLLGQPRDGYLDPDHPVQRAIARTLEELAGEPIAHVAVDGCGAPLFALSLRGVTRAIGRIAAAGADTPEGRVAAAMRTHPEMVGGSGRAVSELLGAPPGLLAKDGAEGTYVAACPDGTAVGVKIADGGDRSRVAVTAAALAMAGVPRATLAEVDGACPVTAGDLALAGELAAYWQA
ncbi:asparaginase [Haloechinothrix sp. LS1_15]|uniref:asparaginase n=1 Tax=Haloechinothrix sp. LS1_15 TaxID=2652248 RepID=UPI002948AF2C|nr:asparaginase [Haloechinothrix sp. LS1_15]MDV6013696.1 asparaginase [Haloechinothrix sp. LS1_15]